MSNFVPEYVQLNTLLRAIYENNVGDPIDLIQKLEVVTYVSTVEVFVTGIKTVNWCLIA